MEHVDVLLRRAFMMHGRHQQELVCFSPADFKSLRESVAALSAQGEAVAWMASDGRVISAKQKERAIRDGGASASSVSVYSEPLYPQPQPQGTDVAVKRGLATGDTPTLEDVWRHLDPTMWAVVCAAIEEARAKPQGAVVDDAMVARAVDGFLANTGQAHKVTELQRELTTTCMRAALVAALGEGE